MNLQKSTELIEIRSQLSQGQFDTIYFDLSSNLDLALKLTILDNLTSGGRSVGIVRSRTQATEFSLVFSFNGCIIDLLCGSVVRVTGCRSRGPEFDFQRYQIFREVVGLERGPFTLVNTIEELLGRKSSGFGIENREYGLGDPLR
jgi:hypothetical protein